MDLLCIAALAATAHARLSLTVDLGYAAYTGVHNASTGLDVWKGIRYANPPTGHRRWQAPQLLINTANASSSPIVADHFGPACPQSLPNVPGASSLFLPGNEDCLFLNVYTAPGTANSSTTDTSAGWPVLVWLHGGGYGEGDATQDLSAFLAATRHRTPMVAVAVQYRLGAFGFLASTELRGRGQLNAGLLDQRAALQWVQQHIHRFGGDPSRVTLAGESAGAGSVLLHTVAAANANGSQDDSQTLFHQVWTASPWIPTQPRFDSAVVERHYADFAAAAGCVNSTAPSRFDCLVAQNTTVLQRASNWVSTNAPTPYGNWPFLPVTDDALLPGPPSLLLRNGVRGVNALIGNNADEGVLLVPATIHAEADLRSWLHAYLTALSDDDIDGILAMYPSSATTNATSLPRHETDGSHPPTANDVSSAAAGQQQRAYLLTVRQNIYAEASVVCPSYWLADAFSRGSRKAYHYQYSVPFAAHGADLTAYWGPPTPNQGPDLVQSFREIIASFVTTGTPPTALPAGNSTAAVVDWPPWTSSKGGGHAMVSLNQTGGTPYTTRSPTGVGTVVQYAGPEQQNRFTVEDADSWEGGRGARCDFWQKLGQKVPE
ncbi:hypothetical protein SCUCBS95973_007960 [Sporothrix curviconia]|uniref:Carboxylic ester hydrolase n=1 Tax=Sporothrix curviconia TaxID=1260050 RepID=A0ABP0CK55_9PEZI